MVLINPVIISKIGLTRFWEACASCMDNTGLVNRPYEIVIEYYDQFNHKMIETFTDFKSTVIFHEYHHLDGILHIDVALEVKIMN